MISPFNLKQLRYVDHSTTFPTSFTAGSNATWTNATNLRVHDVKVDLKYNVEKDATTQTGHHGHPANIVTDRGGSTIEFSMYLSGGSSTVTAPIVATMLGAALGGLKSPSLISDLTEANSAPDTIYATGHGKAVNEGVLAGTRGDGGGDGKLAVVKTVNSADQYSLHMALPAYPGVGAVLKNGHTVYVDATVERYLSFFLIGHYAGSGAADDPDQVNLLGCSCSKVAFSGFRPGQHPKVTFTFNVGDWRNEPNSTKASISHSATPSGGDPAGNLSLGALCLYDSIGYTRTTLQGGDVEIAPNISLERINDPNGPNYTGGWVSVPSETGPTCSITRYWGDMPKMYNDLVNGQSKQILVQWGHASGGTVGLFFQNAFLDAIPERVEFSKSLALKLTFHGDRGRATELTTADMRLQDSPLVVLFH